MQPLNSPVEVGLRTVIILLATYPRALDIERLVLMDYALLHSADLGGAPSVVPDVPTRAGEFGIKRQVVTHGIQLMATAGMVDLVATDTGICYRAGDEAASFVGALTSPLMAPLQERAAWAAKRLADLSDEEVRVTLIGLALLRPDEIESVTVSSDEEDDVL